MNEKQLPLYEQVAKRLIEQLKEGTLPWRKPWSADGIPPVSLPYNEQSGKRYSGLNIMNLLLSGREDPRWMTFKQAEASGLKVNQGEKGTLIQFVKTHEQKGLRNDRGEQLLDHLGAPILRSLPLDRPIVRHAWVFNAEQITGLPERSRIERPIGWDPVERAEQLITDSGAKVFHQYIDRAYYDPGHDSITLPDRSQFSSAQAYYATLLHELGHWTGHPDRLDRATLMSSGQQAYAREELRAEISSILLGDELHIPYDPGQHASYIESWISILTDTPFEIFSAAADAERIFSFLIAIEQKRAQELTTAPDGELIREQAPGKGLAYLSTGDELTYKESVYRITGHLKQGRLRVEQMPSGINFTLSRSDKLYGSLLAIKLSLDVGNKQAKVDLPSQPIPTNDQLKPKR